MGVVARAGVPASARDRGTSLCRSTPMATERRPVGASRAWLRSLPGLGAIGIERKMRKNGKIPSLPEVTSSIEATTPKISEDAVSWGEGPSGTWMCHDPSKDRMSSRGMGPLPRARRPLPKPTLSFGVCEAEAVTAHPKPTLPPPSPKPTLRAEPRAATPQARKEKARERSRASICFGAWRPSPQPPGIGTGIASAGTVGYGSSSSR